MKQRGSPYPEDAVQAAGTIKEPAAPAAGREEPDARSMEGLQALMIDLAAYNVCERLKGQYRPLTTDGTSQTDGKKADTGVIRIDTCDAREIDPTHLRVNLSGIGWQWISRDRERLGATFTVDDNAKFAVDISMVGSIDSSYDEKKHILTLWFVPTNPVDVSLKVTGNIAVDTDSIWSSIVGIAGTLAGESPEKSAEKTIKKQGSSLFQSKLSSGMTLIIDLCSGKHYFKLGTFPEGTLPDVIPPKRPFLAKSRGILHPNSILAAGPFDTGKPIITHFVVTEGGVRASLVCERDADKLARAYVNDTPLPGFKPLAERIIRPGKSGTLKIASDPKCKAVLIMRPVDNRKAAATFDYTVYHESAKTEPLVDCSSK